MKVLPVGKARAQLYKLVDEVAGSHNPIQLSGKRTSAILVAEEDWNAIQETLYLLSIPGMRESIRKGLATKLDECVEELPW